MPEVFLKRARCYLEKTKEKVTTRKAQRPALVEVFKHLRADDTLVVWKLDRLGRSTKELIALINDLAERKVHFKSLTENIDTNTPTGQLIFHIFCSLAEFERAMIRQRTLAGLEAARARKQQLGRPKWLSEAAKQKTKAPASLYREGALNVESICTHLHISTPTLYNYLRHENVPLRAEAPQVEVLEVV